MSEDPKEEVGPLPGRPITLPDGTKVELIETTTTSYGSSVVDEMMKDLLAEIEESRNE